MSCTNALDRELAESADDAVDDHKAEANASHDVHNRQHDFDDVLRVPENARHIQAKSHVITSLQVEFETESTTNLN